MRLTKWLSALVLATASSVLASSVMAQTEMKFEPTPLETVPDAFVRSFFSDSGDYYFNRSLPRQAAYIIGPGLPGRAAFPDLEIERDAEHISKLYREVLDQQVSSDPILRTPDLPNPFNSSVRLLSDSPRFGSRLEGSEFILETVPPR